MMATSPNTTFLAHTSFNNFVNFAHPQYEQNDNSNFAILKFEKYDCGPKKQIYKDLANDVLTKFP